MNSCSIGICLDFDLGMYTCCYPQEHLEELAKEHWISLTEALLRFNCDHDLIEYHVTVGKDENTAYHYNKFYMKELLRSFVYE